MAIRINPLTLSSTLPKIEFRSGNSRSPILKVNSQMRKEGPGRRVWRRRTLRKKDESLPRIMERIPFMEEQVRKINEEGKLYISDLARLLLSEDNRYEFVNGVAAEANAYVDSNMDEYGCEKKAIFHVLTNRMNGIGYYRPDAYAEPDLFKPGPHYVRERFKEVEIKL